MKHAAHIVLLCFCFLFAININHRITIIETNNSRLYSQLVLEQSARQAQLERVIVASAIRESRLAVKQYQEKHNK